MYDRRAREVVLVVAERDVPQAAGLAGAYRKRAVITTLQRHPDHREILIGQQLHRHVGLAGVGKSGP